MAMMSVRPIKFKFSAVLTETDIAVLCRSGRCTFPSSPQRGCDAVHKVAFRTSASLLSQLEREICLSSTIRTTGIPPQYQESISHKQRTRAGFLAVHSPEVRLEVLGRSRPRYPHS
jgi:hypothetical protein